MSLENKELEDLIKEMIVVEEVTQTTGKRGRKAKNKQYFTKETEKV